MAGERAAVTRGALNTDATLHGFGETLANAQPQAGAAHARGGAALALNEGLKDPFLIGLRDAYAGIDHLDHQFRASLVFFLHHHPQHHFAFLGELDGVIHQVGDDLGDARAVAHQGVGHIVVNDGDQFQPLVMSHGGEQRDGVVHAAAQGEGRPFQVELAGLQAGKVENVVDDRQQVARRIFDGAQILLLHLVEGRLAQQIDEAQHPVHGSADLVTHAGQEVRLGLIGLQCLAPGQVQLHVLDLEDLHALLEFAGGLFHSGVEGFAGDGDLLGHLVESFLQFADFALFVDGHPGVEVTAAQGAGGGGQGFQGTSDPLGEKHRQQGDAEQARQGENEGVGHHLVLAGHQGFGADPQMNFADLVGARGAAGEHEWLIAAVLKGGDIGRRRHDGCRKMFGKARGAAGILGHLHEQQALGVGESDASDVGIVAQHRLGGEFQHVAIVAQNAAQSRGGELAGDRLALGLKMAFQIHRTGPQQVERQHPQHQHAGEKGDQQNLEADLVQSRRPFGDKRFLFVDGNTLGARLPWRPPQADKISRFHHQLWP